MVMIDEFVYIHPCIFFQIATLMGFTWIFAFAAAFSGVVALWYIYIIINSLQGLYIFFAFTFKTKIGLLWLKLIGISKSDSDNESNSRTKSSTTKSTDVNLSNLAK